MLGTARAQIGRKVPSEIHQVEPLLLELAESLSAGMQPLADQSPHDWSPTLVAAEPNALLAASRQVVRRLLMPIWTARHPDDVRPARAVAAVRQLLRDGDENSRQYCRVAAKGCTAARSKTIGYGHRVAEAARALALAGTNLGNPRFAVHIVDCLEKAEEELKYEYSIEARYGQEPQIRGAMLALLSEALQ